MKYDVDKVGEVDLTQQHFLAKGGEGSIYARGAIAYKIFETAAKMMPLEKFKDLSVLDHPFIIKPDLLIYKSGKPIGYTMKYVKDTEVLCRLFTKGFQQKNNLVTEDILKLINKLQNIVSHVHSKKISIVDLNEMNFLVDSTFKDIYAIDVNSYQTPRFPATVIMDSVKDRHAKKFDDLSDWFSFAVVTFQMLIGIHPYKGTYPAFTHLPMDQRMDARMMKNISVFHSEVSIPKVCNDFNIIPPALRSWYQAVFDKGTRSAPPTNYELAAQIVTAIKELSGSNLFKIVKLHEFLGDIIDCICYGPTRVVIATDDIYVNEKKTNFQLTMPKNVKIGFVGKTNRPVAAYIVDGDLKLFDITRGEAIQCVVTANNLMGYDGRIYAQNGMNILEIVFTEFGSKTNATAKIVGTALDLPNATRVYDGAIVQNILGRYVVSIFPESGKCYQINMAELDGYKLLDVKFRNNVLGIMAANQKTGKYDRLIFRFSSDYKHHDMRVTEDVDFSELNFSVSSNGICTLINDEEKLEAFQNARNAPGIKMMDDPVITSELTLYSDGGTILFSKGRKLYSISMNKTP